MINLYLNIFFREKNFIPDDCFIESENEVSASVSNAVLPALSKYFSNQCFLYVLESERKQCFMID